MKLTKEITLPDGRKMSPAEMETYIRQRADVPVKFGQLMELLGTVAEEVGEVYRIAERKDAGALLEAQAMKRLELQAQAVRDHCASFLYQRTAAELSGTVAKEAAPWLR